MDVDVAAVEITGAFTQKYQDKMGQVVQLANLGIDYDWLASPNTLLEHGVFPGDIVYIVGYAELFPDTRYACYNLPFVRQGCLATVLEENIQWSESTRKAAKRAFLVDATTTPGLSGSPVCLKREPHHNWGAWNPSDFFPIIMGIISDTTFATAKQQGPRDDLHSFSGFSLAYKADTITDVIDMFFPEIGTIS